MTILNTVSAYQNSWGCQYRQHLQASKGYHVQSDRCALFISESVWSTTAQLLAQGHGRLRA